AIGLSLERSPAPPSNNQKFAGKLGNAAAQGIVDGVYGMKPGPPMISPFNPKMREVKYTLGPMAVLEVPIFDWNQARITKALHEYRQRVAEYEARAQEVARQVRATLILCREAYDQVQFYRNSIVPAVERNLALAQQSYVAGQEDLTIYLQVQEDVLMTRLKTLEFLRDYLVNRAELERQAGGRLSIPPPTTRPTTRPTGENPATQTGCSTEPGGSIPSAAKDRKVPAAGPRIRNHGNGKFAAAAGPIRVRAAARADANGATASGSPRSVPSYPPGLRMILSTPRPIAPAGYDDV
ncbi:MAG: TolC family protein, partial [Phycisphaerae bacterium]